MINAITVTNYLGESITLELRFPEKSGFLIRDVQGLTPVKATIDTTEVATMDGSVYNSARATSRTILLLLDFVEKPTIEDMRQESYKYFPLKQNINLIIETDNRICEAYGYVESNEPTIFSDAEGTTISIVCPASYLNSLYKEVTNFSFVEALFEFPFENDSLTEKLLIMSNMEIHTTKSVFYEGDAPTGVLIFIHAIGPANNIRIVNARTRESMTIDSDRLTALTGADVSSGDDIVISTIKGSKRISLQRAGLSYNIRNTIGKEPNWFQIQKGDNLFTYTADSGVENLQFRVENQVAYEGV